MPMQASTGRLTGACTAGGDLRGCIALSLPEFHSQSRSFQGCHLICQDPHSQRTLRRLGEAAWGFTWPEEALLGGAQVWDPSSHAGAHWEGETLDIFPSNLPVLLRFLSIPADPSTWSGPLQAQEPLPSHRHPSGA